MKIKDEKIAKMPNLLQLKTKMFYSGSSRLDCPIPGRVILLCRALHTGLLLICCESMMTCKGMDTCCSATYMSQTRHQQRFTISRKWQLIGMSRPITA